MPRPEGGEDRKAFLQRCMASAEARKDYPDPKQRYAVCNSFWEHKGTAESLMVVLSPRTEHRVRLRNPSDFKERPDWADGGKFRRTNGGTIFGSIKVPDSVGIIWGQLKTQMGEQASPQALRFKVSSWDVESAKKWLSEHRIKYILFEAAQVS